MYHAWKALCVAIINSPVFKKLFNGKCTICTGPNHDHNWLYKKWLFDGATITTCLSSLASDGGQFKMWEVFLSLYVFFFSFPYSSVMCSFSSLFSITIKAEWSISYLRGWQDATFEHRCSCQLIFYCLLRWSNLSSSNCTKGDTFNRV